MAELRWAETALADLAVIREYLSQHSSIAGRRFVAACFKRAESLIAFPQQGRMTPEAGREDIRELIVEGHRLIYWTDSARVTVLAVIHGRRDFERINPKPWE